ADGDDRGRLVWDIRQLHEACGGNPAEWIKSHDVSLLLTHQGPLWLSEESRNYQQNEINPAGRFALHLFGHEHESNLESRAVGGGLPRNIWQSPSIFGLEKYEGKLDRRHGYAAGRIDFARDKATMRIWPLDATQDQNGWRFVPDHKHAVLEDDGATRPFDIATRKIARTPAKKKLAHSKRIQEQRDDQKLARLDIYRTALLRTTDIVNLAGLPEGDRNLAMERFLLRNLYVPLRVRVDVAADDAAN